jgi:integral membrane protein
MTLFWWIARLEGVSFLLLLLVAMPLKYLAGEPGPVRIVGAVHGLLFLAFVAQLFRVATEHDWPWRRSAWAFVASLLPGGVFWLEASTRSAERPR